MCGEMRMGSLWLFGLLPWGGKSLVVSVSSPYSLGGLIVVEDSLDLFICKTVMLISKYNMVL